MKITISANQITGPLLVSRANWFPGPPLPYISMHEINIRTNSVADPGERGGGSTPPLFVVK